MVWAKQWTETDSNSDSGSDSGSGSNSDSVSGGLLNFISSHPRHEDREKKLDSLMTRAMHFRLVDLSKKFLPVYVGIV